MRKKAPKTIEYNPICDPKSMHGYKGVRWVENVSCGLRRVGFADEIMRAEGYRRTIDHKGWFIHDDEGSSGEVYRGVVYQLPARAGVSQYVYGYDDPVNDDAALLCFDVVTDQREAAKQADRFAEIFAEHERDYDRAWQAKQRYEDLDSQIKDLRKEALEIGEERRAAAKFLGRRPPAICATLRARVLSIYRTIQKNRRERAELLRDYGRAPGFEK